METPRLRGAGGGRRAFMHRNARLPDLSSHAPVSSSRKTHGRPTLPTPKAAKRDPKDGFVYPATATRVSHATESSTTSILLLGLTGLAFMGRRRRSRVRMLHTA